MTAQSIAQTLAGSRRMAWLAAGLVVITLLAGIATMQLNLPASTASAPAAKQPAVGQAITVTGLVFDGARYVNAPIAVAQRAQQPAVGQAITVTGLVFDGTNYRSAPVAVAAPRAGQGYAVTALVDNGGIYRSAPVQVGGR